MSNEPMLRLWDDNPTLLDLLGFHAVVDPIVAAASAANIDPLAIGVHSPWGGGKSTVLNLLEAELDTDSSYVVIPTDPWQYDNHDDVRGDLIVEVLDQLAARFTEDATVKERVKDLVRRLSWARIGLSGRSTLKWPHCSPLIWLHLGPGAVGL